MKGVVGILILLLFSWSAYGQKARRRVIKKEEFIYTWTLAEIRNQTNDLVTKKVEKTTLKFTADSVFVQTSDKLYRGMWTFEKGQLQILIPNCPQCNYKWTIMDSKIICFRIGEDMSRLECFKRED